MIFYLILKFYNVIKSFTCDVRGCLGPAKNKFKRGWGCDNGRSVKKGRRESAVWQRPDRDGGKLAAFVF